MTGLPETVVRVAARSLPALQRTRYREEWLADLDGASEAGVSRASIALAAVSTAIAVDRLDPRTLGMSLTRAFGLRVRAAAGFGLAGALLAAGFQAYAGFAGLAGAAIVLVVVIAVLAVAALVATVSALRAAVAARRIGAALLVLAGALGLPLLVASELGSMLLFAGAPGIGGLVAIALLLTGGRVVAFRGRLLAALVVPVAAAAVAAFALLHVFVWNPLAKLPGMTLVEIYAALAEAGEGPLGGPTAWVVAVALSVGLAAVGYAVFILAPVARWRRLRTRRRLVALGLLLVGGVTVLGYLPGFTMGMGMADAFMTSGGDAAPTGAVLALIGMLALAGTIVVSFVRVEPAPPVGAPSPVR